MAPQQERVWGYNGEQYTPQTGSFLTRDRYLGSAQEPITQNRYAYANNDPVQFVDPTGHQTACAPHSLHESAPMPAPAPGPAYTPSCTPPSYSGPSGGKKPNIMKKPNSGGSFGGGGSYADGGDDDGGWFDAAAAAEAARRKAITKRSVKNDIRRI